MKAFSGLIGNLKERPDLQGQVEQIVRYLAAVPESDGSWAIWMLANPGGEKWVALSGLRKWVMNATAHPEWMIQACHGQCGDWSETLALLMCHPGEGESASLSEFAECFLRRFQDASLAKREMLWKEWTQKLDFRSCRLLHDCLRGSFHPPVLRGVLCCALGQVFTLDPSIVAQQMELGWDPGKLRLPGVFGDKTRLSDFQAAMPLSKPLSGLGHPGDLGVAKDWLVEWNLVGPRAQWIWSERGSYLWSSEGEILNENVEHITRASLKTHGHTVLEGVVVPVEARDVGASLPGVSSRQVGRNGHGTKFVLSDILLHRGKNVRTAPYVERRVLLEKLFREIRTEKSGQDSNRGCGVQADLFEPVRDRPCSPSAIDLMESLRVGDWESVSGWRKVARTRNANGIVLRRFDGPHPSVAETPVGYEWKSEAYRCLAVLLSVESSTGRGRQGGLGALTLGVLEAGGRWVSIARISEGLSEKDHPEVMEFARGNVTRRFGPVRALLPHLVFELEFEGIRWESTRLSRLRLVSPTLAGWRRDLIPEHADTLEGIVNRCL